MGPPPLSPSPQDIQIRNIQRLIHKIYINFDTNSEELTLQLIDFASKLIRDFHLQSHDQFTSELSSLNERLDHLRSLLLLVENKNSAVSVYGDSNVLDELKDADSSSVDVDDDDDINFDNHEIFDSSKLNVKDESIFANEKVKENSVNIMESLEEEIALMARQLKQSTLRMNESLKDQKKVRMHILYST